MNKQKLILKNDSILTLIYFFYLLKAFLHNIIFYNLLLLKFQDKIIKCQTVVVIRLLKKNKKRLKNLHQKTISQIITLFK